MLFKPTAKNIKLPSAENMHLGIVVAEWNDEFTQALYKGALKTLISNGAKKKNIISQNVPGSFELPAGAQMLAEKGGFDAIICIGCIIQGKTRHFEIIAHAVAKGIIDVGLKYKIPVIFGVLTPDTPKQAAERAGGKYGNKGVEAAISAIKMASLKTRL